MNIFLNGEPRTIEVNITVQHLLADMDLSEKRIAVEVNREIIPQSLHVSHVLKENDVVEIVHAVGGG